MGRSSNQPKPLDQGFIQRGGGGGGILGFPPPQIKIDGNIMNVKVHYRK